MTKVLARKAIVKTAMDFAITGSAACPGIKFIYIGKAEVESKMKLQTCPSLTKLLPKCDSAKAQPMKKLEMEVARSHCLHFLNSFEAERLFCLYII